MRRQGDWLAAESQESSRKNVTNALGLCNIPAILLQAHVVKTASSFGLEALSRFLNTSLSCSYRTLEGCQILPEIRKMPSGICQRKRSTSQVTLG